jgi:hypothetical protein
MSPQPQQWTPPAPDKQAWTPPAGDAQPAVFKSSDHTLGENIIHAGQEGWGELSNIGQGMVDMATTRPDKTLGALGAAQDSLRLKIVDAVKRGDLVEAGRHALNYLIPAWGPSIDKRGDQAQAGDVFGALGGAATIGGMMTAPGALEGNAAPLLDAADTVGTAVKGAVKGAANTKLRYTELIPAGIAGEIIPGVGWKGGIAAGAGLKIIKSGWEGAREALAERGAPSDIADASAEDAALLDGLARGQGIKGGFAKATPEEQATLRSLADRMNGSAPAEATAPQPAMGPPAPAQEAAQPTAPGPTLQEMLQQEFAARRAATPEPSGPAVGGHDTSAPLNGRGAPLRPPWQPPAAEIVDQAPVVSPVVSPAEAAFNARKAQLAAAEVPAAPKMSLDDAEADMAATSSDAAQTMRMAQEARYRTTPAGQVKSPEVRGVEKTAYNTVVKAQRVATALDQVGITADTMPSTGPQWGQVMDFLKAKKLVPDGETPPDTSLPVVAELLKRIQAAKAPQEAELTAK